MRNDWSLNPISSHAFIACGPGSLVGIAIGYVLDGPGIESRWGQDFPHLFRPTGAHPASCKTGTGSFPGGKERPGRDFDPSSLLVPWPRKSRAIPLLPLWAVRPVQSLSACTKLHFTFYVYRLHRIIFTDTGIHRDWGSHCKQKWCLLPHNCATWTLKSHRCSLSNFITWTSADAVMQMSVFWDKTSSSSSS